MFHLFKRSPQAEHHFCQENLSPFLDGQLSSRELARVERHLKQCADCHADLESLRRTVGLLHHMPVLKPPRSFLIPASAAIRQRQVQRTRLAYGYVQFATAVAGVLLVLVVSGDAWLRLSTSAPVRQTRDVGVETTFAGKSAESSAPEAMPTQAPAILAAPAPAPGAVEQSPQATAVAGLGVPVTAPEAGQIDVEQMAADETALAKAAPSQTFARAASAPAMPTATPETAGVVPPAAEVLQPSPTPVPVSEGAAPTALPTETPVPAAEMPAPEVVTGAVERHELPSPPTGPRALLEAVRPLLPWLELTLSGAVLFGLVTSLWLRRTQHLA